MEREKIESTALKSAGYNPDEKVLELEFEDGSIYQYQAVPPEVFGELMQAESKGTYFNAEIDGHYEYQRVKEAPRQEIKED